MTNTNFENSVFHSGREAIDFAKKYFCESNKKCLLVASAGFDPRTTTISKFLRRICGIQLNVILFKEIRKNSNKVFKRISNENIDAIRNISDNIKTIDINIFGGDSAPIAGMNVIKEVSKINLNEYDEIILDPTAMSLGIWFPLSRFFIEKCEKVFHIMINADSNLDEKIIGESSENVMSVKGFWGANSIQPTNGAEYYRYWLPFLARNKNSIIERLGRNIVDFGERCKICPILPFPSLDPRSADELLYEYKEILVDVWDIDTNNIIYISDSNPINGYRVISNLARHLKEVYDEIFNPSIILSPIGNKLMSLGAMLAAIECNLTVKTFETVRFDFNTDFFKNHEAREILNLSHFLMIKNVTINQNYDILNEDEKFFSSMK